MSDTAQGLSTLAMSACGNRLKAAAHYRRLRTLEKYVIGDIVMTASLTFDPRPATVLPHDASSQHEKYRRGVIGCAGGRR
ncbi:MAG: hypothetical protein AB7G68_17320 [Nitrospiraceae bacterium]